MMWSVCPFVYVLATVRNLTDTDTIEVSNGSGKILVWAKSLSCQFIKPAT